MACDNQVGVKNILITFTDCDTDEVIGPIKHDLAGEDLPTWRNCQWVSENMPGGYVRRTASSPLLTINVIRDTRIPLSYYQGCASLDIQVEMMNGIVQTGVNGGVTGDDQSDLHEVTMNVTFKTVDELLPSGALASAA